eukprot:sb/3468856/
MESVSLDLLRNYILSKGGTVTSQEIVREFQPFLKDPVNKERNKGLFKSYLSTLTEYRQDEGSSVKILELKKAYRTDAYLATTPTKENHPANKVVKDSLQPMRDRQKFQRDTQRDVLRNRATTEAAARTRSTQPASSEGARRSTQPPASSGPVDHAKSRTAPAPKAVTPSRVPEESAVTPEAKEQPSFLPSYDYSSHIYKRGLEHNNFIHTLPCSGVGLRSVHKHIQEYGSTVLNTTHTTHKSNVTL